MNIEIGAYNNQQNLDDKEICDQVMTIIDNELSEAESKIWHSHPVWFLDGNPIVGYNKQKAGIRLIFWSGADFEEEKLNVRSQKFKYASIFFIKISDIEKNDLKRWLKKSREIQWDYKNIVKKRTIRKNKLTKNLMQMKKLQFNVKINAPVNKVYDYMLGISNKSTYEQWTALFNPTSSYEGSWNKGSKMLFVGTDEQGEKGGMVSEIVDNMLNQFISIRHYGLVKANVEITEGPEVEKWANGFENYTFIEKTGTTTVTVDLDLSEDFLDYMNGAYPKALDRLKEICEV